MVSEKRWRDLEDRQRRSVRIRERFGLTAERSDGASDWLLGPGSIPVALAVIGLVVYAVITMLVGAR